MENMFRYRTTKAHILFVIMVLLLFNHSELIGQYEKNPLPLISNDGYSMIVEKFVKIPDDTGNRPRINCFTHFQNRIFVAVESSGRIYEIMENGNEFFEAVLFFDVGAAIPLNTGRQLSAGGNWHAGLRSVAFHPDFLSNGKFYTSVMEERPADNSGHNYLSDVEDPVEADGTLIEWTYNLGEESVDLNSYRELFRVGIPVYDHPIKQIAFNRYANPEDEDYGLLYIAHGDGSPQPAEEGGGQNNDGRGKIFRIDPLQTDSTLYSIPSSNPFVNDSNWLDEIYATGFRNPHSLCFARDASGEVYLISGNAGRKNIEEINVVFPGENYGWSDREGTYVHLPSGELHAGIEALPDNDADNGFTYPAAQWSHADPLFNNFSSKSIVGGYVYTNMDSGERLYLSSDFTRSGYIMYNRLDDLINATTKLNPGDPDKDDPEELTQAPLKLLNVYFDDDNDMTTPPVEKSSMLDVIDDESSFDGSGRSDIRFGQDMDENIYLSSKRNGWIYKVQYIGPMVPDAIESARFDDRLSVSIYPNPVSNTGEVRLFFNNVSGDPITISVVNTDGQEIFRQLFRTQDSTHSIDLESLHIKSGLYFLYINSDNQSAVQSLVVL